MTEYLQKPINAMAHDREKRLAWIAEDQMAYETFERLYAGLNNINSQDDKIDWLYEVSLPEIFSPLELDQLTPSQEPEEIEETVSEEEQQLIDLKNERQQVELEIKHTQSELRSISPGQPEINGLRQYLQYLRETYEGIDEALNAQEIAKLMEDNRKKANAPPNVLQTRPKFSDRLKELELSQALWVPILSNIERLLRDYKQLTKEKAL